MPAPVTRCLARLCQGLIFQMAETGRQGGCGGTKGLRGWEEGSTRLEAEHPSPPCPQTHGGGGGAGCGYPHGKSTFPTFKASLRGQDVPHVLPCPGTPHPSLEQPGGSLPGCHPPSQPAPGAGSGSLGNCSSVGRSGAARVAPLEGSVTTRRARAGGRLPVTRSWGRTALFPFLTSGPRVPAGWERTPPNEPTPAPTCRP